MPTKPSMLIVDDEINVARTLQIVFEREGYKVKTAFSCAQALPLLHGKDNHPDAVITDLNMEKEDIGLEVARAAVKLNPRPVVIICTGYASTYNSEESLKLHVDYLAIKPVDLEELKSALSRLMARRATAMGGSNGGR